MKLLTKLHLRNLEKLKRFSLIFISVLICSLSIAHIVSGVTMEPGSNEDPLVSKSYVDSVIEKLGSDIASKINAIKSEMGQSQDTELMEVMAEKIIELSKTINNLSAQLEEQEKYLKFEVIELEAGQKIILGESSEVILRGGKALAIASEKGDGLADITTDGDKNTLVTDDVVPLNHLLLISRDDGRGVKAVTKMWILVKGSYTVVDAE